MTVGVMIVIATGALAGGVVSGLAGFGTGITAMGIWLYAVPPQVAASLVIGCSVVAQMQTLPAIWHDIDFRRVSWFIVPGLIGVPLGTWMLGWLDPHILKAGIGCLLLVFSGYMLLRGAVPGSAWGGRAADGAIGLGGGVLGGLVGLSGPLPTMWATVRGWTKGESRSVFQAFNTAVLVAALGAHAVGGLLTRDVLCAFLAALPGTMVGAWLGVRAYGRVSDVWFRRIILALLCGSGATLLWTNS
jgi:uncharacterized membrane protein YfcA